MTLREAQERVDAWIKTYGVRYFSELTNIVKMGYLPIVKIIQIIMLII